MEISAIMNIHELAAEQTVKQKTDAQVNRKRKDSKDEPMMDESEDSNVNRVQKADEGQGTEEETLETGHIVNLVT